MTTRTHLVTHRTAATTPDLRSDLVARLKLQPGTAKNIAQAAQDARTHEEVDAALELADQLINGYGVEALDADPDYGYNAGGYYQGIVALYVNVGDPYVPTLLYDTENEIFMVAGWGDFLEAWEREHPEETRVMEERDGSLRTASDDLTALVEALNSAKLLEAEVLVSEEDDPTEAITVVLCYVDNGGGLSMADEIFLYTDTTVESALEQAMTYVVEHKTGDPANVELYQEYLKEEMEGVDPADEDAGLEAEQRAEERAMEEMEAGVMYEEWETTRGELAAALDQVTNEKNLAKI